MAQSPSLPSVPRPSAPEPLPHQGTDSGSRSLQDAGPFGLDQKHGTELGSCSGPGHRTADPYCPLPTALEPAPGSLPGRLGSPAVLGGQALPEDPAGHKAKALKAAPEGRQGYCMSPREPGHSVLASHPSHPLSLPSKRQTRTPGRERTAAQWPREDQTRHCTGRRELGAGHASSFPRTHLGQWPGGPTRGGPTIRPVGQKPPKPPPRPPRQRTDGPRSLSVGVVHSEKGRPSAPGSPSGFGGDELGPQA